ncbi:T9SS type A sorting domain-containing protein [Membranihabitans maritimus]|uniref:T9SS type A sorting domain-containing protein n=1 Tax=Membranihabitans maritimus TaxID=2904244 RepID=UPI001F3CF517|nr:T9SS type A sorting domain-containing protein [Membranihabitans maritimus]
MKKLYYYLLILFAIPLISHAQDPLYNFDFADGMQDWTPNSVECAGAASDNALWMWVEDGSTEQGIYSAGFGTLDSRTPDSGIVILNSEFLDNNGEDNNEGNGTCPAPQIAELVSPSLDFSAEDTVILSFNQLYYRFSGYTNEGEGIDNFNETATYLEITANGEDWNRIALNDTVNTFRWNTLDNNELTFDISEYAAGESDVQVKFVWEGNYYFWGVDDVRFYGSRRDDIAITAFKYVPSNFETPASQIVNDTFNFVADIVNLGTATVDSAYLKVYVRANDGSGVEYFRDSVLVENMAPNDTMEMEVPNFYVPNDLAAGSYVMVYRLTTPGGITEVNFANNFRGEIFIVSEENKFRKTDRSDGSGIRYQAEEYLIGNYYEMADEFDDEIRVKSINFSNFASGESLQGKSIIVYLLKISDDIAPDFSNFDFTESVTDEDLSSFSIEGIGSYSYTAEDDNASVFSRFSADIFNFENTDDPVVLDPGGRYIAAVSYDNTNNTLFHEVSERITYYSALSPQQISTVVYVNGWAFNNPMGSDVAVVGMDLEVIMTSNEQELAETEVSIFPNPAQDYVNIDVSLENPQKIQTYLTDATGKILDMKVNDNFYQGRIRYDVSTYPTGTYFLKVNSSEGTKVKKISVLH